MTGRDVEREIETRIHQLKVAIKRWEDEEFDPADTGTQLNMLNRWHARRQALEDLLNWYRAETSKANRKAGKYNAI